MGDIEDYRRATVNFQSAVSTASFHADVYRNVAGTLANAARTGSYRAIVFSGVNEGSGTTTAVFETARQLESSFGLRVLAVDLNSRSPSLSKAFGLDQREGVTSVGTGTAVPRERVCQAAGKLAIMPAGNHVPTAISSALSEAIRLILQDLEKDYDMILFDAPPVLESAETIAACGIVSRLVLIVEAGRTRYEMLTRVKRDLAAQNVLIVGAILNKHRHFIPSWVHNWLVQ